MEFSLFVVNLFYRSYGSFLNNTVWGVNYTIIFSVSIILIIVGSLVNWSLKDAVTEAGRYENCSGLTGREIAEKILDSAGVIGVIVESTTGFLSDHYNSKDSVIRLCEKNVYDTCSIAAAAIAAHECGHAIQAYEGAKIYAIRQLMSKFAGVCAIYGIRIAGIGIILSALLYGFSEPFGYLGTLLLEIGIAAFFIAVIYYALMIPFEIDASRRGMKKLIELELIGKNQRLMAKRVLRAAGSTYVVAFMSSLVTLMRLLMILRGRNR